MPKYLPGEIHQHLVILNYSLLISDSTAPHRHRLG